MDRQRIGRYTIEAELARGGMATVYRGYDPRFKRTVAIKALPAQFLHDQGFLARFEREAQTVAALEHPAIVPVYDFGEDGGQPYLIMRYMSGGTLTRRLLSGPPPIHDIAALFERLAPALDFAHRQGVIHRDLKPGNILFDQHNKPYLSDFGIVKLGDASIATLTATGGILGTPAYMSPEQARGKSELDGRSDLYALGVILFELLTGTLPYNSDTPMGLAMMHVLDPVPNLQDRRSDLPPQYQAIIDRAMAKEREARYQTAGALSEAVSGLVTSDAADTETEPAAEVMAAAASAKRPSKPPEEETPAQPEPGAAPLAEATEVAVPPKRPSAQQPAPAAPAKVERTVEVPEPELASQESGEPSDSKEDRQRPMALLSAGGALAACLIAVATVVVGVGGGIIRLGSAPPTPEATAVSVVDPGETATEQSARAAATVPVLIPTGALAGTAEQLELEDEPTLRPTLLPTLLPTFTQTPSRRQPTATPSPETTAKATEAPTATTASPNPPLSCTSVSPTIDGVIQITEWGTGPLFEFESDGDAARRVQVFFIRDAANFYLASIINDPTFVLFRPKDSLGVYFDANNNAGDPDEGDRFFGVARDGTLTVRAGVGSKTDGSDWDAEYTSENWAAAVSQPSRDIWVVEMVIDVALEMPAVVDGNPFGTMFLALQAGINSLARWPESAASNNADTWQEIDNVVCE